MKKFLITEEEKNKIRNMYGIVNEQTITLPYPVSDTFTSYDGDDAHNLKGLEKKIDKALEEIYNQGINPKMYNVSLKIVRNGNTYTTTSSLTIDKSDDGKAWTGFASRGSIGYDYVNRADGQIDGSGNADGRSLKEKLESIGAVEIIPISNSPIIDDKIKLKQYFVQFTKIKKPSHTKYEPNTPPKPQPIEEQPEKIEIIASDLTDLENKFEQSATGKTDKEKYTISDISITPISENRSDVKINFNKKKDPNGYKGAFLFFTPVGQVGSDLQQYIDSLKEKTNLVKVEDIIKDGRITWVGSEWDYKVYTFN